jgi:hypothetical protein
MLETQCRLSGVLAGKGLELMETLELGEEGSGMMDYALQGLLVRFSSFLSRTIFRTDSSPLAQRDSTIPPTRNSDENVRFLLPSIISTDGSYLYRLFDDYARTIGSLEQPELYSVGDSVVEDWVLTLTPVPLGHPQPDLERAYDSCEAYLNHLHHVLAYASPASTLAAVEYCLAGLDTFTAHINHEMSRILDHATYTDLPRRIQESRPFHHVNNFVLYRIMSLETRFATHLVLSKVGGDSQLVRVSEQGILQTLDDLALLVPSRTVRSFPLSSHFSSLIFRRLQTLFGSRPMLFFFITQRLILALGLVRVPFLTEWASSAATIQRERCVFPFLPRLSSNSDSTQQTDYSKSSGSQVSACLKPLRSSAYSNKQRHRLVAVIFRAFRALRRAHRRDRVRRLFFSTSFPR